MTADPHDHDRPDTADMRAALAAARATLEGAKPAAVHQAAEAGSCPACVAVAATSFGVNLGATLLGDTMQVSERSRCVSSPPSRPRSASSARRQTEAGPARRGGLRWARCRVARGQRQPVAESGALHEARG